VFTAYTFNPNIHAHPNDFHFIGATRMGLFHLHNIAKLILLLLHSSATAFSEFMDMIDLLGL
jgi:hypothetical protein